VFKYSWEVNQLVEAGKPLGVSRSNFGIAQLNNYIYVVGGYNEKLGTLKSCEVLVNFKYSDNGRHDQTMVTDSRSKCRV
jgi:hypothetical protein